MKFNINNRSFVIYKGSDVDRDGVYVELNEFVDGQEKLLCEIFYYDETGEKVCNYPEASIPYQALLKLIEVGDSWLEPKADM